MKKAPVLFWALISVGALSALGCLGVGGLVWLGHRVGPSDPPPTESPATSKVAEWKRKVLATWTREAYERSLARLMQLKVGDPMTQEEFRAHMGIEGTFFTVPAEETEPVGVFGIAELGDGYFGFMTFDNDEPPVTVYRFGYQDGARLRQRAMVTFDRTSGVSSIRLSPDPAIELPVPAAAARSGGDAWIAYLRTCSTRENFEAQIPAIEAIEEDAPSHDVFAILSMQYFIDVPTGAMGLAAPGFLGPEFQSYDSTTKVTRMGLGHFDGATPVCRVWITTTPTGTTVEWQD